MSERRFVLVNFTHMNRVDYLRLYEAGHTYTLPRAVAHAASKRGLIASSGPRAGRRRACSDRRRC